MTEEFRSGFVTLVGRPNVGKSTLLNQLVGSKVAIVSDRPQTTRTAIRGVRTTPDDQIVFVDTPGIHKPRTPLGERTNERAVATLGEVDVVCLLVEADAPIGAGDRFVAGLVHQVPTPKLLVVNKIDRAGKPAIVEHLATAARDLGDFDAYLPSRRAPATGSQRSLGEIESRLPEGPRYYPEGTVTDQPETFVAAELVREKLLAVARDELPHSITVSVEELEDIPRRRRRRRRRRPGRDPAAACRHQRRARLAEGHRHRAGRTRPEGRRHRRPPGARGAPRRARLSRDASAGRTRLAASRPRPRPPRLLKPLVTAPVRVAPTLKAGDRLRF